MVTKESKLNYLYTGMDWKDYLGIGISVAIVLLANWFCFYALKNVEAAITTTAVFASLSFGESAKNYGIIKRLNERVSNLEEQLAEKRV